VEVSKQVDWLSCSIPSNIHPSVLFPLCDWVFTGSGKHGYRTRYEDRRTNAVCETDATVDEMGTHFQFSGSCLSNYRREFGATDNGFTTRLARAGAKASRIDLAIDLYGCKLTPRSLQRAINEGRAHAKANVSRFIEGKNGQVSGDTFYIGSPTADRQFRCYDKGAEQSIVDGQAWIRLELELRRVRARSAFASCALNGTAETVSGHMGDFMHYENAEYQLALSGPSVQPAEIARKKTNRQRWLLGQVAQALAKEIVFDVHFRALFDMAVAEEVDRLQSAE
jgi:hypothetical protein